MKVLIVHDYGTLNGGAEILAHALRQGLRQRGHDARFFASRARPIDVENIADYTCVGTMSAARRMLQVANPWAARSLREVLSAFRPDVVHVRMFFTQLSPLILPVLRGERTLLHLASYELICPLTTKTLPDGSACGDRAGRACYRHGCVSPLGVARTLVQSSLWRRWQGTFDLIAANSEWTRRRLLAEGIEATAIVPGGVPVVPPRPPLDSPPTAAFAARLVPEKGADVLLRAWTRVVHQLPGAVLLLAGDGPEREATRAAVADLALTSNVRLLGHQPRGELDRLFASAWVQAVPSRWEEPFGLVAAEAMMRGTAVVASSRGGLSEQVREGRTGFLVPPGDPDALAEALLRVLQDRALAERMGAAGRAVALAEFSEDRMVEDFLGLYARLLEDGPREGAGR